MRKPAFCTCGNKDADKLRGNREAGQRLCFRYMDSTILFFLYTKFILQQSSVAVQPDLCRTWSETPVFSQRGSPIDGVYAKAKLDSHAFHYVAFS